MNIKKLKREQREVKFKHRFSMRKRKSILLLELVKYIYQSRNFTGNYWFFDNDVDIDYWLSLVETHTIRNVMRTMSIIWYSITLILGTVGNSLVIWIAGFKMKTVSAVWFLNLAFADFVTCVSLPLRISEWALYWEIPYDHFLCKAGITILLINMLTSVYFMTVISIDRCVSVFWPIWTKIHRTPRLATIIAVLVWLLCLLTSVPHLVFNYGIEDVTECFPKYQYILEANVEKKKKAMFITRNIFMFAFPFAIILISYGLILFKIRALRKTNRSHRSFRVITAVIVCFFICWFPYNTWPLITLKLKYQRIDIVITEVTVCLAYFSSCINPLLYVFFSHDFKKNFVKSIPAVLENALNECSDDNCMDNNATMSPSLNLDSSSL
ncbi:formyl peptide receptor 2-like [Pseudophryne corroboree]|uniref:formyl peptide receptor 2-like n=1 Tax=Pseudophryne corroboree TaxID=495146 RepID=UPI0030819791